MSFRKILLVCFIILLAATGCRSETNSDSNKQQSAASEHAIRSTSMELHDAWARPASQNSNSAVYLQIYNGTTTADTLLAAYAEVAGETGIHESFEEDGLMGMRPAGWLAIPSKSDLKLEAGGLHIMLKKLKQPLAEGDSITVALEFAGAGKREVTVPVRPYN